MSSRPVDTGGVDAWKAKYCSANDDDVVVARASLCRSGGIAIAAIRRERLAAVVGLAGPVDGAPRAGGTSPADGRRCPSGFAKRRGRCRARQTRPGTGRQAPDLPRLLKLIHASDNQPRAPVRIGRSAFPWNVSLLTLLAYVGNSAND